MVIKPSARLHRGRGGGNGVFHGDRSMPRFRLIDRAVPRAKLHARIRYVIFPLRGCITAGFGYNVRMHPTEYTLEPQPQRPKTNNS